MNQQILSDAEVRDIEDLYLGEDGATPAKLIRAIEALVLQRIDALEEESERYADDPDSGYEYQSTQERDHG